MKIDQFLNRDKFIGDIKKPLTLNKYLFTAANPVNYVDLSGQYFVSVLVSIDIIGNISHIWQRSVLPDYIKQAWKHKKMKWSVTDEEDFRRYIESNYDEYKGKKIDCADLAMTILVDFASEKGLPVVLRSWSKKYDSRNGLWFRLRGLYKRVVKRNINANMLYDLNTYEKGKVSDAVMKSKAKLGDLMIGTGERHGHTRIFLRYIKHSKIIEYIAGDLDEAVSVKRNYINIIIHSTSSLQWWSHEVFGR